MSGNQNFDKSAAKHIAGGKGESATGSTAPKPFDKNAKLDPKQMSTVAGGKGESATSSTAPKPFDKNAKLDPKQMSTVAGGFVASEQKVTADVKPLSAKVGPSIDSASSLKK